MYKWMIIGGGIQGSCVASRLLSEKKVTQEELIIIDPHAEPLERWRHTTGKIGMDYLRSPVVHHLDTNPFSLKQYASKHDYAASFRGQYKRPRLDMFNEHCLDLMEETGVMNCWKQGTVNRLSKTKNGWEVELDDASCVTSEKVILAIGVNHVPFYPECMDKYKKEESITHVFDMNHQLPDSGDVIIVGGGMTAGHLACTLSSNKNIQSVHLIKRHPFRINRFDSDPGWLGPKYMDGYHNVTSYKDRRLMIKEARNRGSVTKDLYKKIKKYERNGDLKVHTGDIKDMIETNGRFRLELQGGKVLEGSAVVLATGADIKMPGKSWIDPVIKEMNLPCAPCGFPVVSKSLEWKQGLYVAGALAELEIGPVARNIAGARKVSERITQFA
ncbi:FAD/NAD(P)-binding protein [Corticicoccus populi]|uniref:FAD/NAD(P)-binding protein n=1 Tax=Corticicoccus populi TaxID=1812821 RepID=A0ABW5WWT0_9STAP